MSSLVLVALLVAGVGIAHAETGVLHLTWRDNSTNEDGFLIERSIGGQAPFGRIATVGANKWGIRDSGLLLGRRYCYRVRAFNGAGVSGYSETVCGVAGPPPPVLTLSLNQGVFEPGDRMVLTAHLDPGVTPRTVDAYIVVLAPGGTLLSLQGNGGAVVGLAPSVRRLRVASFGGEVFSYTFTGAEPAGKYTWFAGLTWPGTLGVIGLVSDGPSFVFSGP